MKKNANIVTRPHLVITKTRVQIDQAIPEKRLFFEVIALAVTDYLIRPDEARFQELVRKRDLESDLQTRRKLTADIGRIGVVRRDHHDAARFLRSNRFKAMSALIDLDVDYFWRIMNATEGFESVRVA